MIGQRIVLGVGLLVAAGIVLVGSFVGGTAFGIWASAPSVVTCDLRTQTAIATTGGERPKWTIECNGAPRVEVVLVGVH